MRVNLAGLLVAAALWPSVAAAQDAPSSSETVEICDVTDCSGPRGESALYVSQRFRAALSVTPAATLLSAEQIERLQPLSLADGLQALPTITLSRSAEGTAARLRGAAPLVTIGGLTVNDPYTGGFDLAALPIDAFPRTEVLAGPQSADWGEGAAGGLIALQDGDYTFGQARLAASGDGGWAGRLSYGAPAHGDDNSKWSLGIAGFRQAGASQAASGSEKDALQSLTAGVYGTRDLPSDGRSSRLTYSLRLTDTREDIDGYDGLGRFVDTGGSARRRSALAYVQVRGEQLLPVYLGPDQQVTLGYYRVRVDPGAPGRPGYDAERRTVRLELISESWGRDVSGAALGLERTDTSVSLDGGGRADRGITSIYFQGLSLTQVLDEGPEDNLRLQGRLDIPDGHDPQFSLRLSDGWWLYPFRVTGSIGRGYSLPSLAQALCDLCTGPPSGALTPETTLGWDLTLGWEVRLNDDGDRLNLELTGFGLRRDNQIRLTGGAWRNLGGSRSDGLELLFTGTFSRADFKLRYVYTDARDDVTGTRPLGSPRQAAWLSVLVAPADGFVVLGTVRAQSDQLDLDPSTLTVRRREGFATADLDLSYDLGDVDLYVKIENLTDARYQQTLGYGETGRAVWIGLRLGFI